MDDPSPDNPPLVIKIGGAALDEPAGAADLWSAVAEAHRALDGMLVLVHGGGVLVDRHLERLGIRSERREGIRITPPEHVEEIAAVLAGRLNKAIVGAIQRQGLAAAGLCLGDGRTATTVKADHYSFDPGCVGRITGGDPGLLRALFRVRCLPVVSSIGLDADGTFLNVNADDAAAGLAAMLGARGLVLLTDVAGILGPDGGVIARTSGAEIESLIARAVISGGMIPKARAAARTADETGVPTIIASFRRPTDLPRLARGESIGTTVVPSRRTRG